METAVHSVLMLGNRNQEMQYMAFNRNTIFTITSQLRFRKIPMLTARLNTNTKENFLDAGYSDVELPVRACLDSASTQEDRKQFTANGQPCEILLCSMCPDSVQLNDEYKELSLDLKEDAEITSSGESICIVSDSYETYNATPTQESDLDISEMKIYEYNLERWEAH